jgi:hypothetical protein
MINSGWFAETFPLKERLPTLAEYYQSGLRLAVEPGTIWSTRGSSLGSIPKFFWRRTMASALLLSPMGRGMPRVG